MINALNLFFLANLALSFYLVGAIWAIEVDIFRSWQLVDASAFATVQKVHWQKLAYWVFAPLALALAGSIILVWYHPAGSPAWGISGNLACQVISHLLTAILWGPCQAKLSRDPAGPQSIYLAKILRTHWIRTTLINTCVLIMLAWAVKLFATT